VTEKGSTGDTDLGKGQPFALLHIPHSSTSIPVDLRETLLLSVKVKDWGDLIQIAAPDTPSNAAK
jgi:hypothetical protein